MTRTSDEQLELDFEGERSPSEETLSPPNARLSASIIRFPSHLRSLRTHEGATKDAKLLERITSRVQHFK